MKSKKEKKNFFLLKYFKASYFTSKSLKTQIAMGVLLFVCGVLCGIFYSSKFVEEKTSIAIKEQPVYWMELFRKSNKENLYHGVAGDKKNSKLVKSFVVKTGIPGQRPTPLPQLVGRKYWKIIKKYPSNTNPETAPYFLELDIPVSSEWPFGPVPYNECSDPLTGEVGQCNWELPGYFGLHGINGDVQRLTSENPGSSGCIRHTDSDITYLYNLLEVDEGVRYYVVDS